MSWQLNQKAWPISVRDQLALDLDRAIGKQGRSFLGRPGGLRRLEHVVAPAGCAAVSDAASSSSLDGQHAEGLRLAPSSLLREASLLLPTLSHREDRRTIIGDLLGGIETVAYAAGMDTYSGAAS